MKRFVMSILAVAFWAAASAASDGLSMHWPGLGKDAEAYDSMMEQAAFMDVPRSDLGAMAAAIHESSRSSDRKETLARSCYWKGWVLYRADPDSATRLMTRALQLCDSAQFPYDHARFSLLRADLLRAGGSYAEAYFIYRDRIRILKEAGDDFWAAKATVGIGTIMQELGENHEALANYREAERLFEKAGSYACVTKNRINLANCHFLIGDRGKALEYLRDLERSKYVVSDSAYMANVLVSRFEISDYTDREAALKAYELSRRLDNSQLSVIAMMSMGILANRDGDNRRAVDFMRQALDLTERMGDLPYRKDALESLGKYYEALGLTDSAAICRNEVLLLNESYYHQENVDNLKRAEHLATINRYEERISQEADRHRLRQTLVISLASLVLVVLALSLCLMWYSKRKAESDRNLKEEKNRGLELLNRQYSMEIEAKEKELASNTVLLAQKNARLKELAEQIKGMQRKGDIAEPEGNVLNDKISRELSADDDWRYFKLRFEKVHPMFFQALKEAYPGLSKTDLRLCAYVRVGMSAKEIAQVMSVRPDTVNTSRYRIRKKLNLTPSDSLESTLEKF